MPWQVCKTVAKGWNDEGAVLILLDEDMLVKVLSGQPLVVDLVVWFAASGQRVEAVLGSQ